MLSKPYLIAKIAVVLLIAYVLGMMLYSQIGRSIGSFFLVPQLFLFIPLGVVGAMQMLYGWKKQQQRHRYAGLIVIICQLVFLALASAQFVPMA